MCRRRSSMTSRFREFFHIFSQSPDLSSSTSRSSSLPHGGGTNSVCTGIEQNPTVRLPENCSYFPLDKPQKIRYNKPKAMTETSMQSRGVPESRYWWKPVRRSRRKSFPSRTAKPCLHRCRRKVACTGIRPLPRRRIMCASGITEFFCPGHSRAFFVFRTSRKFYIQAICTKPNPFHYFKVL